jgi:hypothetical protein
MGGRRRTGRESLPSALVTDCHEPVLSPAGTGTAQRVDPDPPFRCFGCDAVLDERTHYCPHCGVRLDSGVTEPPWPGPSDPTTVYTRERPRLIGIAPQDSTLVLGAALAVLGVVLLAVGVLLAGALVLVAGLLFLAVFVQSFRRRPASRVARQTGTAYGLLRAQLGFTVAATSTRARGRVDLLRLRRRVKVLTRERRGHVVALGESIYAGDAEGAAAAHSALHDLDVRISAATGEISRLERRTAVRIRAARWSRFRRAERARTLHIT